MLKVKDLKELLNQCDDEQEVFIRNSVNPVGNIYNLGLVEVSSYGFFGGSIPCIILDTTENIPNEITDTFSEEDIDEGTYPRLWKGIE